MNLISYTKYWYTTTEIVNSTTLLTHSVQIQSPASIKYVLELGFFLKKILWWPCISIINIYWPWPICYFRRANQSSNINYLTRIDPITYWAEKWGILPIPFSPWWTIDIPILHVKIQFSTYMWGIYVAWFHSTIVETISIPQLIEHNFNSPYSWASYWIASAVKMFGISLQVVVYNKIVPVIWELTFQNVKKCERFRVFFSFFPKNIVNKDL